MRTKKNKINNNNNNSTENNKQTVFILPTSHITLTITDPATTPMKAPEDLWPMGIQSTFP